jgi:hypothetical protein
MQQIQLNIIPIKQLVHKCNFAFYGEKQKGFAPIYWGKLFENLPESRDASFKNYYTDFLPARQGAIEKEIVFTEALTFSFHYYRYLILKYFQSIEGAIVFPNFTHDIEVWFEDKSSPNKIYKLYDNFTIKVQYKHVTDGYELVLAYNGTSKVLRQSIADISDFDTDNYNLINCNGSLYKYENIPPELKQYQDTLYPVLSNSLKIEFNVEPVEIIIENRYKPYLRHIEAFYKNHINTPAFTYAIGVSVEAFYSVNTRGIYQTSKKSNELQFLENTHINPGLGILLHKPLKAFTKNHVKLFFIYHKDDGELIRTTLYEYIINGWHKTVKNNLKHSKNLQNYINQPLSVDKTKRIVFQNTDTIFEEVSAQIKNFVPAANTTYVAIYITPIHKTNKEHPQHNAYYKIKEVLLDKGISSQVVYKEHLDKDEFYYFLPNIYVALLAKIGGIPWRLARTTGKEIIIGIGAFKPKGEKHRFLGSAFCFSNEGVFEGFNCFKDDEPTMLAGSIQNAVELFIEKNKQAQRIIIHFYKEISDKNELQPILDMLINIGAIDIPVIVVTINKTDSKELMGFDMNSQGKMPLSGSYLKVGYNKFLLFNNTRYTENDALKPRDYHFPIKLSIKATNNELVQDMSVISELVDQVYQFSRMYWKSISQQNMPVTTKYPEMVAEIFPHFEQKTLTEFGTKNLWFL